MHVRFNRVRTRLSRSWKTVCTVPLRVVYLDFWPVGPLILTAEKSRRIVPVVPRTHFRVWQVTPVVGRDVS